ncbi:heterokaryon incompatibility protein-domain-containing protein [Whalleya microplaca]|nr:heterokaryon incompatibility protein-domain-containing protein [Whalleya microplaca]
MRLINVETFVIHEFIGKSVPEYAILSHTWEDDEVLLQDMLDIDVAKKKHGFRKIESCCRQARDDGWDWAWVDTCCIDKTSSAELSEAINSMFQWYARSMVCYVYLSDITSSLESDLHSSRWFFRGWTLQELVAPFDVVFYSHPWNYIGTKLGLNEIIESITGIHKLVLSHDIPISEISVATRMHWANKRQTTRVEDMAYSLLGIFDVNMTLLYGEGSKAFGRLQEQILRATEDHTIFLWDCKASDSLSVTSSKRNVAASRDGESTDGEDSDDSPVHWQPVKMLAQSPSAFHRNRLKEALDLSSRVAIVLQLQSSICHLGMNLSSLKEILRYMAPNLGSAVRTLSLTSRWQRRPSR